MASRVGSSTCCLSDFLNALALSGAMVVVGRLEWVLSKISRGHRVVVTSSYNAELQKQKMKVLIQPVADEVPYSEMAQCCAVAAINSMLYLAKSLEYKDIVSIMDRGHRHSSGVSEACFWMKIGKMKGSKEAAVAEVVGEALSDEGILSSTVEVANISGANSSATIDIGNTPLAVVVASIPATYDIGNTTLEDGSGRNSGNITVLDSCDVQDNAGSCGNKRTPALELEKSEKKPRLIVEM